MLKKSLKRISFAVLSLFLVFSIILTLPTKTNSLVKGWSTPNNEESLSPESKGDNPLRIVIEESEEDQDTDDNISINQSKTKNYPDLGSPQVFPFEAGLGAS